MQGADALGSDWFSDVDCVVRLLRYGGDEMTNCPRCNSHRVKRVGSKVQAADTGRSTVWAYWNVCLDCSHQWDGVSDGGKGVLPAWVGARGNRS